MCEVQLNFSQLLNLKKIMVSRPMYFRIALVSQESLKWQGYYAGFAGSYEDIYVPPADVDKVTGVLISKRPRFCSVVLGSNILGWDRDIGLEDR